MCDRPVELLVNNTNFLSIDIFDNFKQTFNIPDETNELIFTTIHYENWMIGIRNEEFNILQLNGTINWNENDSIVSIISDNNSIQFPFNDFILLDVNFSEFENLPGNNNLED